MNSNAWLVIGFFCLIILFIGDPDLLDAIISNLMVKK
jgi:hypothetical protein